MDGTADAQADSDAWPEQPRPGWVPPPGLTLPRRAPVRGTYAVAKDLRQGRPIPDPDLPLARVLVARQRRTWSRALPYVLGAWAVTMVAVAGLGPSRPGTSLLLASAVLLGIGGFLGESGRRRTVARVDVLPRCDRGTTTQESTPGTRVRTGDY